MTDLAEMIDAMLTKPGKRGALQKSILTHVTQGITFAGIISLMSSLAIAQETAQNIRVFGAYPGRLGGAFGPAGTSLACWAIDAGRCWDGKKWHNLFPLGPRKYAVPTTDTVVCLVIAAGDCWTGKDWYRLPSGQIAGRTPIMLGGAFVTAPLR